ncbi:MAG: LamG-like jellyroll fold domain-containing protein [Ignavibacteria bacterium]
MNKNVTTFVGVLILVLFSIKTFGQAPVITKEPSPIGVIVGQTAVFSVEASGDTLSYQWFVNNSEITGANNSVYTTAPTILSDNLDNYKVIVSNVDGNDTSITVRLYVTAANKRVAGSQVALYDFKQRSGNIVLDVSGLANHLDLQINDTTKIDWSNNGLYVNTGALIKSPNNDGTERIIGDMKETNELTVEMWLKPLTVQARRIIELGTSSAQLNFEIENLPPNGYNFAVRTTTTNNAGSPGVVDTTDLSIGNVHLVGTRSAEGESKIYLNGKEVMRRSIGGDFSNWLDSAPLTLASSANGSIPWTGIFYLTAIFDRALDSAEVVHNFGRGITGIRAPFIIQQPEKEQLLEGFSATFRIHAVGNSVTYQWQKNGVNIPGATDTFYVTPAATLADSGTVYRVIATNSFGADTSDNALLEVRSINTDCPAGITNYYHLDESSSPYNDFVGFSDGLSSVSPASVPGTICNAVNFSVQEKIDIAGDAAFNWAFNQSFSIEVWVKTTATPSTNIVMVGRDDAVSTLFWWVGMTPNGRAVFQLRNINNQQVTVGDELPAINDGSWHLITAVRDNSVDVNYIYVDGNITDMSGINYSQGFESTAQVNVGHLNSAYYFGGTLDEIAFYSVALSQAQIQEHYINGLAGFGYCEIPPTITAPSNLVAVLHTTDSSKVDLTWNDNSPDESGFIIQRANGDSVSGNPFSSIDTVNADITSYTDLSTDSLSTYTYRIYAYNADTVSTFSYKAEITTSTPVELTSFTASVKNGSVLITWETATEINNAGFSIERRSENGKFADIAFIKGKGTTTNKSVYSYLDKSISFGKFSYRLKQVDYDGSYTYSNVTIVDLGLPKDFALAQNYPNPFNPSTTIKFTLPANAKVTMKVYNTLGQEVALILSGEFNAGIHEAVFNASGFSSGVYLYRLEAAGTDGSSFVAMKRMLLVK